MISMDTSLGHLRVYVVDLSTLNLRSTKRVCSNHLQSVKQGAKKKIFGISLRQINKYKINYNI